MAVKFGEFYKNNVVKDSYLKLEDYYRCPHGFEEVIILLENPIIYSYII
jgi:hypothetical protein